MLKILVALPMYGGSLPIGRYCARALAKLGHSVRVFDAPKLHAGYEGIRRLDLTPPRAQQIENAFLRVVCQALWSQAEEQQPDIVLALAQAPLDQLTLQKMRKAGMKTVMWFVEDYRVFTYWQTFAPLYDAFAVIQKEPFLTELAAIGQKHAFYLPLAADPDFHKPMALSKSQLREYGSDLAFLGAGYPNRRAAFRPLASKDFKIWGSDWDDEKILAKNIQRNGARIGEEESVAIYNAAKINLNLHSSLDPCEPVSHGDFVNPRVFELAAIGAFQLVDERSLLPDLFGPDDLATFNSIEDFYRDIDYFLQHPKEREKYVLNARERVLKKHTYQQRMLALLDYMQKNFPIETREPRQETPGELSDLALRLGLAANAGRDDLLAALRRQGRPITAKEASLLFGAEWEKMKSAAKAAKKA